MKVIVFPVPGNEPHAAFVSPLLDNTLAEVGNLIRDHGVYGPMSPDARDQANQLAETAMQIVATAGSATDSAEGSTHHFTSKGRTAEQDIHYTAIINDEFRALMGAIVNLITARDEHGAESEAFALAGLVVVVAAEQVFMPATRRPTPMSEKHSTIIVHVDGVRRPARQIQSSRELSTILAAWKRREIAEAWKTWALERFGDQAAYLILFVNDDSSEAWHILVFNGQCKLIEEIEEGDDIPGLPVPHSSEGLPDGWSQHVDFGIDRTDLVLVDITNLNLPTVPVIYAA